jgi:hypothetical protein
MTTPLESLRAAVNAAFGMAGVDLEAPRSAIMRIIRSVGTRLSLQKIDVEDQAPDANPIEVWPGVPGVSSDPSGGEEVILSFVGQNQVPFVTGWSPVFTPLKVRHDAKTEIRFVSLTASVAAKVYVGAAPTTPVAMSGPVTSLKAAIATFATSTSAATTAAQIATAAGILNNALTAIPSAASTNLEAK